jgi:hypothetical protein
MVGYAYGNPADLPQQDFKALSHVEDKDGAFVLNALDAGPGTLIVRAPGYVDTIQYIDDVPSLSTFTGVVVAMEAAASVTGQVVDTAGHPVAAASLYVGDLPAASVRGALACGKSDSNGGFQLNNLPRVPSIIWAYHPDYAPGSIDFSEEVNGGKPINIVLTKGGTLQGAVYRDGAPVALQEVLLLSSQDSERALARTQSAGDGRYRFEQVLPGEVQVVLPVWGEGNPARRVAQLAQAALVRAGDTTVVDLDWPDTSASLTGRITVNGVPASGAFVTVHAAKEGSEIESNADVAEDGTFNAAHVPAGMIEVVVEAYGEDRTRYEDRKTLNVAPGETAAVDFTFPKAPAPTG